MESNVSSSVPCPKCGSSDRVLCECYKPQGNEQIAAKICGMSNYVKTCRICQRAKEALDAQSLLLKQQEGALKLAEEALMLNSEYEDQFCSCRAFRHGSERHARYCIAGKEALLAIKKVGTI